MIIIFDLRPLLSQKISGVEVYTKNITEHLAKNLPKDAQLIFWTNASKTFDFEYFKELGTCIQTRVPNKLFNISSSLLRCPKIDLLIQKQIPEIKGKQTILFIPDPRPSPISANCKKVFTIHDLSPFYFTKSFNIKTRLFHKLIRFHQELIESKKIIAVSDFTKKSIHSKFRTPLNKIVTIHEAAENAYFETNTKQQKPKEKLPKKYILSLSTLEPRKNLDRTIKAFLTISKKQKGLHLILVGKKNPKIFKDIPKIDHDKIIWIDRFVNLQEKKWLYKNAQCFVYASLFEGFGLPLLEAASQGCPVVYGNNSSMPEVMQNKGFPVNSLNIHSIEIGITKALQSKSNKQDLIDHAKSFSWNKAAKDLITVFENL